VIVVDTHVVVWLALEPGQLSKQARAAIDFSRQNGEGARHLRDDAALSYRSAVAHVSGRSGFRRPILRIQQIVLSGPLL